MKTYSKNWHYKVLLCGLALVSITACSKDEDEIIEGGNTNDDSTTTTTVTVSPVTNMKVETTLNALELFVSCTAPAEAVTVRISCVPQDGDEDDAIVTDLEVESNSTEVSTTITVNSYATYLVSAIAIDNDGNLSEAVTLEITPLETDLVSFLQWSNTMMSSVMDCYFGKSDRDCWNSTYPNSTGPYWDGDAVVWGQGAGLSAYVAVRDASLDTEYESQWTDLTDRMFESINRFITSDNGISAYAVYPANGNDRYFDDNVWIGLDMVELYNQTGEQRFLDKAIMVWDYLMTGYDDTCGGGIHWQELNTPSVTKHTCSTAPTAVLGCMLYQITNEERYKSTAIGLYNWLITYLQDPTDHLFWDNINPDMVVEESKYSYNSGQPMLAACLLYQITNDTDYLEEARQIAYSAHRKWFESYYSSVLKENISMLIDNHAWFSAVMFRGFVELYKIDPSTQEYIDAYADTMIHAWLSDCRNQSTNLLNYDSFKGDQSQTSWEILHEAACVEMLARLAKLENEE